MKERPNRPVVYKPPVGKWHTEAESEFIHGRTYGAAKMYDAHTELIDDKEIESSRESDK